MLAETAKIIVCRKSFDPDIEVRWRGFKYVEPLQKRLARRAGDLDANIRGKGVRIEGSSLD